MHRVIRLLEKNDIPYWSSGGTFLGAIRCKGIIKWDDDLDLCVLYQDRDRLKNVIDQENDIYLDLRSGLVNKIKYKTGTYPFIDIFFMVPESEDGQTVYKCALKRARDTLYAVPEHASLGTVTTTFGKGLIVTVT